ncbi:hypothetical protein H6G33_27670 [Calothrix sp. FACHB-1219]|uniref:hypothetical protein n=1 Tax=unclassified Calothrix TaxID=2619626 RepID=UPI00168601F3|nr:MULTISPECIES: hypothetical protein [unclassified Calothrix]MBD2206039.1 hypothetical protein [Calothrix sp. FACHB-168]MBD2220786.1 hypothetical protein [Calothrix sp. FACHB-1219]
MYTSSILAFMVALIAMFLRFNFRHEEIVVILTSTIAVISLFISFVFSPMVLKIVILVTSLWGLRYYCRRRSCDDIE